jgi:hypothetical protein
MPRRKREAKEPPGTSYVNDKATLEGGLPAAATSAGIMWIRGKPPSRALPEFLTHATRSH